MSAVQVFTIHSGIDAGGSNDHGGTNVVITTLDKSWDSLTGAQWISYANTVCPGCIDGSITTGYTAANFFDPTTVSAEWVTFTQLFTVPAGMYVSAATLDILGDDSIMIGVNGVFLPEIVEPGAALYNFECPNHAAPTEPADPSFAQMTCTHGIGGGISLSNGFIAGANNTPALNQLQIMVTNRGKNDEGSHTPPDGLGGVSSFGLSYVFTFAVSPIPEPGTVALVGIGLLLGFSRLRKKF